MDRNLCSFNFDADKGIQVDYYKEKHTFKHWKHRNKDIFKKMKKDIIISLSQKYILNCMKLVQRVQICKECLSIMNNNINSIYN